MTDSTTSQERRPIPGYEGIYEIDLQGNVYTLKPSNTHNAGHMRSGSLDPAGYVRIALCRDGGTKFRLIHRLVMLSWKPVENSDELDVNHLDGNRQNNHISNLEWCTHAENMRHAGDVLKAWERRNQRGDTAPYTKLTEEKVREIRRLRANGMTQTAIAAIYGVTPEAISAIVLRKNWKCVE